MASSLRALNWHISTVTQQSSLLTVMKSPASVEIPKYCVCECACTCVRARHWGCTRLINISHIFWATQTGDNHVDCEEHRLMIERTFSQGPHFFVCWHQLCQTRKPINSTAEVPNLPINNNPYIFDLVIFHIIFHSYILHDNHSTWMCFTFLFSFFCQLL